MKRLAALLALIVIVALPIVATTESEADKEKDKEDKTYQKATSALDAERWTAAIAGFRQIVNEKGPRADRAMYWLAYAQFKSGRPTDALSTIQDLRGRYPKSDWIDDAEAMEVEIRQDSGQNVAPESMDDEELKLIAITSLMGTDPERALTILEKILAKKTSSKLKERALFVVGQLGSARAQKMLETYARNNADPELQRYAIRAIGITGRRRDNALLEEIFRSATNHETKEAILEAFMISNDRSRVLAIAENDPDPRMRKEAVQKLGVMHATADLQRLYAKEKSRDVKESIIQGLFVAGDLDTLAQLARNERDEELRKDAIRSVGLIGGRRSFDLLMEIWNTDASREVKEGVIEALFIRQDANTLIAFAKKETDKQLKREIVQRIALMHTKEAREYMQELLDK